MSKLEPTQYDSKNNDPSEDERLNGIMNSHFSSIENHFSAKF